jgi:UDP-glucuronate decarboxylase
MRLLVAGGGGFIGTHLIKRLLEAGHYVISVDNFVTGNPENYFGFHKNYRFEKLRHDITFPLYVEVDGIFNLACPASPNHYQKDPIQTLKTSVMGSINLLGLAKRTGSKILLASTSEIYGDPKVSPQNEQYWGNVNPIGIRSCYDEGKRAAETLFFDYNRQHKVDIRVARIFNTYGPGMSFNDGRVISNFIHQALNHHDITIYGDGTQTRSFCYIDDLVDGIVKLFNCEKVDQPVNLGNPEQISIHNLANEIIRLSKSESTIVHKDLPPDDPKDRLPDIRKAKELLNWQPYISRDEGLAKTIENFRERLA